MSTTNIVVFGATGTPAACYLQCSHADATGTAGFTCRLMPDYLAHHPKRTSFTFGVAGRSQLAKLEALKKGLGLNDTENYVEEAVKSAQVEEAVKSAQVVVNAVGPSIYWDEPVLRVCLKHRRQYVELCEETPGLSSRPSRRYGYVDTKASVLLVPSCGFDSVPAELVVYVANKTLKATLCPRTSLGPSLTVYRANGGFSGGTLASMMAIAENVPIEKLQEVQADYALGPAIGKSGVKDMLWYEVPFAVPNRVAMYFFMAPSNRVIVQLARAGCAGLVERHKRELSIRNTNGVGSVGSSGRVSPAWISNTSQLAHSLLLQVIWFLKHLATPPGPSEEKMKIGFFQIKNHSRSVHAPGIPEVPIRTVMRGQGDPGYLLSARMMIPESALAIVLEKDKLPRMAQEGGILTPATAFGDVLGRGGRRSYMESVGIIIDLY
ncbi:uncharacterized protein B0H18DRAFT_869821 [Fomitopsis serialis]|uniref:uncharacterized protein n=1 Tax=Fomitopsis serialis TaxID=139415 RepID=UPI002008D363|nr:uncharacterized protein B0H18DRAFT_869821 [Neoantrodia serialis]KAH9934334.1 hypothetical protein B0H18DRAFT_869821 [Neoantrodia serialis]